MNETSGGSFDILSVLCTHRSVCGNWHIVAWCYHIPPDTRLLYIMAPLGTRSRYGRFSVKTDKLCDQDPLIFHNYPAAIGIFLVFFTGYQIF